MLLASITSRWHQHDVLRSCTGPLLTHCDLGRSYGIMHAVVACPTHSIPHLRQTRARPGTVPPAHNSIVTMQPQRSRLSGWRESRENGESITPHHDQPMLMRRRSKEAHFKETLAISWLYQNCDHKRQQLERKEARTRWPHWHTSTTHPHHHRDS